MNLTATKEADEAMERHIEDSLAILPPIRTCYSLQSSDQISLIDVGSGASLSGLVLAIACLGWRVTLESINKRCVFLEHIVTVTGLTNVKIVRGRAEVASLLLWLLLLLLVLGAFAIIGLVQAHDQQTSITRVVAYGTHVDKVFLSSKEEPNLFLIKPLIYHHRRRRITIRHRLFDLFGSGGGGGREREDRRRRSGSRRTRFPRRRMMLGLRKMNLTATKEADEVMKRHIEDSLAILSPIRTCYSLQSSDQISLIDVGSGASLPGLVLAIACPACVFLEHVVTFTRLTNVKIVWGRAEWGCDLVQRVWLPLLLLLANGLTAFFGLAAWNTYSDRVLLRRISIEKGERFRVRKSLAKLPVLRSSLWVPFIDEACVLIGCHVSSSDCADTLLVRVKSWLADGDLCRVASKSPGGSHAYLMWIP
ncbi:hypothetical protein F2Q69_00027032 [Brassica cretica]|uniref:Uncharacterized protein n=1 Tax=Brassica cretica TaxID=69181 RepID=A0A8S9SAB1_BRACR|nr:hypothetical protein F2Q69_00027032 [Brassica cretica]